MLTTKVDNYPATPGVLGPDLMTKMREHASLFGVEFIAKNVETVNFSKRPFELTSAGAKYLATSVILATGADTRWLGVPGEDKLRGRGVSSCAPCDAPFFRGKKVVVVGGGDSAMEEALVLTKYATSVSLVHRRGEFRASAAMQQKVFDLEKSGNINIFWDSEVTETLGQDKLESVRFKTSLQSKDLAELKDKKIGSLGGKVLEEKENYLYWEVPMDGVFVAIGHVPSTSIFKGQVDLDEKGYVRKVPNDKFQMSTSVDGVFVAGDVHDYHYRQAITAAGFGCMAGMDALRYLDKSGPSW